REIAHVRVAMTLVERPRATVRSRDEHHDVAAAERAGFPLPAGEERGAEATRLMRLGDEQEPQVRGAIQGPSWDEPRQSDDAVAVERREHDVSLAQRRRQVRLGAALGDAVATKKR